MKAKITMRRTSIEGDPRVTITAVSSTGISQKCIVDPSGILGLRKIRKAQKKLLKRLQAITGHKHKQEI